MQNQPDGVQPSEITTFIDAGAGYVGGVHRSAFEGSGTGARADGLSPGRSITKRCKKSRGGARFGSSVSQGGVDWAAAIVYHAQMRNAPHPG